ncbi:hypothetical protein llap_13399 [Limosa lapponica baueri]|uniref:Uncharacterized protein n=1 Tax=Limosa lapponica baueri TaxID=1758121 RepID=A0A2I0TR84_LIMLA|nr:hypothetical protein llap_13399 [Limosa lapponica baueri]
MCKHSITSIGEKSTVEIVQVAEMPCIPATSDLTCQDQSRAMVRHEVLPGLYKDTNPSARHSAIPVVKTSRETIKKRKGKKKTKTKTSKDVKTLRSSGSITIILWLDGCFSLKEPSKNKKILIKHLKQASWLKRQDSGNHKLNQFRPAAPSDAHCAHNSLGASLQLHPGSWTRFGHEDEVLSAHQGAGPALGIRMRCYQPISGEETGNDGFGVSIGVVWW